MLGRSATYSEAVKAKEAGREVKDQGCANCVHHINQAHELLQRTRDAEAKYQGIVAASAKATAFMGGLVAVVRGVRLIWQESKKP